MRHQRKTIKLGRKEGHRKSLLANLAVSLIEHNRTTTTLAKAKARRPTSEKLARRVRRGLSTSENSPTQKRRATLPRVSLFCFSEWRLSVSASSHLNRGWFLALPSACANGVRITSPKEAPRNIGTGTRKALAQ